MMSWCFRFSLEYSQTTSKEPPTYNTQHCSVSFSIATFPLKPVTASVVFPPLLHHQFLLIRSLLLSLSLSLCLFSPLSSPSAWVCMYACECMCVCVCAHSFDRFWASACEAAPSTAPGTSPSSSLQETGSCSADTVSWTHPLYVYFCLL